MKTKLMLKKALIITLCITYSNAIMHAMMSTVAPIARQTSQVAGPALGVAAGQLVNNLSGNLNNINVGYNPQVKNYNTGQQPAPQYSGIASGSTKFNQYQQPNNTSAQYNVDVNKAFRDAQSYDLDAGDDLQSEFEDYQAFQPRKLDPTKSIAQNLYGNKSSSPFAQQRRDYSTFRPKSNDPYEILGVSRGATKEEIKAAYLKLAKQYHPDVNQENREEATKALQQINNAYDKLSNSNQTNNTQENWSYNAPKRSFIYKSFHEAIINGDLQAAQDFLTKGSDIDEIGLYGWTTLEFCLKYNFVNEVVFLINHGADINRIDKDGKTPLDLATYPDLIAFLKQRGAKSSKDLIEESVKSDLAKKFARWQDEQSNK